MQDISNLQAAIVWIMNVLSITDDVFYDHNDKLNCVLTVSEDRMQ